MDQKSNPEEAFLKGVLSISIITMILAVLPVALYWIFTWKSGKRVFFKIKQNLVFPSLITILSLALWFLFADRFPLYEIDIITQNKVYLFCLRIVLAWLPLIALSVAITPLVLKFKKQEKGIRTKNFIDVAKPLKQISAVFNNSTMVPIGYDVKTGEIIALAERKRPSHMLTIGATGTGKSNLMTNLILHAIRHRQPCVVIDPKGESSSLESICEIARKISPDFDSRLRVFSMSNPNTSAKYNPLKHGNANQLKDRIMEAFVWSEQYYQNVAASFLTALTSTTEFLGIPLTLAELSRILTSKDRRTELLQKLQDSFEKQKNHYAMELFHLLKPFFEKSKVDDLSGLAAQISILNNPTFGSLLSFDKAEREIDLRDIRKNSGIAYFQLDTLGNADSARRLGRMIIEDLKSLSSEIYKTEPNEKDRIFFPIFIDEFGSFASREFIEFLKQSRGAKFAIHPFCQGLEDMDAVSPEFRRQVISNTMTKIGLRMDDHETVEEFCATAGTFDALEQSYQVQGNLIVDKTGMGNMRETKQMQIEHDVLKQLRIGQAVLIEKSPSVVRGVQIPQFKELLGRI